jgi:hypothetical protein
MAKKTTYTCRDYREEMMLLGLKNRLKDSELSDEERRAIIDEIRKLESAMGLD